MSGLIIFCFIVYHLLHFTVQIPGINFTDTDFRLLHDAKDRHDVFAMMVLGFRQPLVSIFYMAGMALLSLHLSHGISAMFQSLGWKKRSYAGILDGAAKAIAIFIFIGYSSIPIAIWIFKYGQEVK
jgi:succinate dehydrogenase / fumarate reductase cytochrome b subunit